MKINSMTRLLVATLLLGLATTANALSISLTPTTTTANIGDTVSFDIIIDFTNDATLGGFVDVNFDASVLSFDSFTASIFPGNDPNYIGDVGFVRPPDIFVGLLNGLAFGDFAGLTTGRAATVSFVVIGGGGSTTSVLLSPPDNFGPFVSSTTFQPQEGIQFFGASLDVNAQVPIPAALWLMIGGLGVLTGFGRKSA